jgi:hypothetical protein
MSTFMGTIVTGTVEEEGKRRDRNTGQDNDEF